MERAKLIQEKKRIGLSPEGFALIGQESKFSYENACTQLLSKCQANCMEEWYPFTSIFLPIIGYRSAKQRQCMDRCINFANYLVEFYPERQVQLLRPRFHFLNKILSINTD